MKGYFRKRGDKWSFTVDIGVDPVTGKRKQKTVSGFKTKKEAQTASASLQHDLSSGTFVDEKNILFKDFAESWLDMYRQSGHKESSVRVREYQIKTLLKHLANIKLRDVTKKQYQTILNELKKGGMAHTTLSGVHTAGKMIFKKAIEFDLLKADPTQFAKVPITRKTVEELEQEEEIEKYLEKEELAHFLKTAKLKGLEEDYLRFLLLTYTGMRVGELCALKWKDLDFKEKTVSITKTLYNPDNEVKGYILQPPKTKTSRREIEIDSMVLEGLEKHRVKQNITKMKNRDTYHDEDFIFTKAKAKGYPISVRTMEYRMKRLLKLADLNLELSPHSLRHTHTSLLAEAGVGLHEIMQRLGHKNDSVTRNVYLHVTREMKKETSSKFSALMKSI